MQDFTSPPCQSTILSKHWK